MDTKEKIALGAVIVTALGFLFGTNIVGQLSSVRVHPSSVNQTGTAVQNRNQAKSLKFFVGNVTSDNDESAQFTKDTRYALSRELAARGLEDRDAGEGLDVEITNLEAEDTPTPSGNAWNVHVRLVGVLHSSNTGKDSPVAQSGSAQGIDKNDTILASLTDASSRLAAKLKDGRAQSLPTQ